MWAPSHATSKMAACGSEELATASPRIDTMGNANATAPASTSAAATTFTPLAKPRAVAGTAFIGPVGLGTASEPRINGATTAMTSKPRPQSARPGSQGACTGAVQGSATYFVGPYDDGMRCTATCNDSRRASMRQSNRVPASHHNAGRGACFPCLGEAPASTLSLAALAPDELLALEDSRTKARALATAVPWRLARCRGSTRRGATWRAESNGSCEPACAASLRRPASVSSLACLNSVAAVWAATTLWYSTDGRATTSTSCTTAVMTTTLAAGAGTARPTGASSTLPPSLPQPRRPPPPPSSGVFSTDHTWRCARGVAARLGVVAPTATFRASMKGGKSNSLALPPVCPRSRASPDASSSPTPDGATGVCTSMCVSTATFSTWMRSTHSGAGSAAAAVAAAAARPAAHARPTARRATVPPPE